MPAEITIKTVYFVALHGAGPHALAKGDWQFAPAAVPAPVETFLGTRYHEAVKALAEKHPAGGTFYLLPVTQ